MAAVGDAAGSLMADVVVRRRGRSVHVKVFMIVAAFVVACCLLLVACWCVE